MVVTAITEEAICHASDRQSQSFSDFSFLEEAEQDTLPAPYRRDKKKALLSLVLFSAPCCLAGCGLGQGVKGHCHLKLSDGF